MTRESLDANFFRRICRVYVAQLTRHSEAGVRTYAKLSVQEQRGPMSNLEFAPDWTCRHVSDDEAGMAWHKEWSASGHCTRLGWGPLPLFNSYEGSSVH